MKYNGLSSFSTLILILFSIFVIAPVAPIRAEKNETYLTLKGDQAEKETKKVKMKEEKETGSLPILVGMGAGFSSALGSMNNVLLPGFIGGKIFLQYYRIPVRYFGAGLEFATSYLQDREIDGGMLYLHSIPYLTLNFNPGGIIELQGRLGGGITWLCGEVETGTMTGTDFTFYTGIAVMKTFSGRYMVGAEGVTYYYFERKSSACVGLNLIFGYHL